MIARAAFLAGRAAIDAADAAHWSGVWMSWWHERVTVNEPQKEAS